MKSPRVHALIALAVADTALLLACSSSEPSTSAGGSSGSSSSSSGSSASCPTKNQAADLTKCERQLTSHVYNCPNDPQFPPSSCRQVYVFPCGLPGDAGAPTGGGDAGDAGPAYDCASLCAGAVDTTLCRVSREDGSVAVTVSCGSEVCGAGRRPESYSAATVEATDATGAMLATIAQLEAGAIRAFDVMLAELDQAGAPAELLARVASARLDEVRHARAVAQAARARGARIGRLQMARPAPRDLVAIAIENAREGCVRETFGALVATVQEERAAADLRELVGMIARDEIVHAQLSWDVGEWLGSRLTERERAEVDRAIAAAFDELDAELAGAAPAGHPALGMPGRDEQRALLRALRQRAAA
ncbi:MAG: hypothetical protein JNL38_05255 [Myxococcales bacterium]|nr:hypothetical protein [Myxococcales bacterium]